MKKYNIVVILQLYCYLFYKNHLQTQYEYNVLQGLCEEFNAIF